MTRRRTDALADAALLPRHGATVRAMLGDMIRAWFWSALALTLACGPVVPTDSMGEEGDSTGAGSGSSESGDTGSGPGTTTTVPGTSSSTTLPMPRPDLGGMQDIDGTYLLAVAAIIDPGHPLQYIARVQVSGGTMQLVLQPLSLAIGSTTEPRQPYGDPVAYEGILVEGGCFTLDMGLVTAAGATNPITGSDITTTLVLEGCFEGTFLCGTVSGFVSQPLQLDLTGSTFAAVEANPSMLPVEFPTSC